MNDNNHSNLISDIDWPGRIFFVILLIWITLVIGFGQYLSWFFSQIFPTTGADWPFWLTAFLNAIQATLILVPTLLLTLIWPRQRFRAVFQTWTFGSLFMLIMLPAQLVELPKTQTANLIQILTLLFALILIFAYIWFFRKPQLKVRVNQSIYIPLITIAIYSYPWLAWGALGSPLDTTLNFVIGCLFGLVGSLVLCQILFRDLAMTSENPNKNLVLGGLTCGTLLLIMAAGLGLSGLQLLLILALPSLAWCIIASSRISHRDQSSNLLLNTALIIGLAAALPLMVIDPDEMQLILAIGTRDLLSWAFYAALISLLLGWSVGLILVLTIRTLSNPKLKPLLAASATLSWLLGISIYFLVGQPGFFGEQLFVILRNQADIASATQIDDYDARRQYVYDTLIEFAAVDQQSLRVSLDRFSINYTPYYLENALLIDGGPLIKWWLESRPEVDRVLDNPILRPLPALPAESTGTANPPDGPTWNLTSIKANRVWDEFGVSGQGIVIGQSDSGVDGTHPEIAVQYRGRGDSNDYNWLDPWYQTSQPTDLNGHGTHTLGTIIGKSTGVAPGAHWIGCVNLARNLANPGLYLDCLQFMLAPYPIGGDPWLDGQPTLSAHVLNNSWGCPEIEGCDAIVLKPAVSALRDAGIFVVASAGNDGPTCETINQPLALFDEVFSVGAVDQSGFLASFSSRGPVTIDGSGRLKPDVVAPGVNILSAFPNNSYEYLPGTSMAGPHVVGLVALMWSANPELIGNIDLTERLIVETTRPISGHTSTCGNVDNSPNNDAGYGIIDAFAAVQAALELR